MLSRVEHENISYPGDQVVFHIAAQGNIPYKTGWVPSNTIPKNFQNNHKNLDPSYKMDLDIWNCFRKDLDGFRFSGLF